MSLGTGGGSRTQALPVPVPITAPLSQGLPFPAPGSPVSVSQFCLRLSSYSFALPAVIFSFPNSPDRGIVGGGGDGGRAGGDPLRLLESSLLTKPAPSCSAHGTHCPYLTGESGKPSGRQGRVCPCQRPTATCRCQDCPHLPRSHLSHPPSTGPSFLVLRHARLCPTRGLSANIVSSRTLCPWLAHYLAHTRPLWLDSLSHLTSSSSRAMVGCFVAATRGRGAGHRCWLNG